MPTQSTTYNSRITDEALEKRFRDTFRSQGGAELVDDLYASGVIIPVVDFTSAAEGSQLGENLQTAIDFATGFESGRNTGTTTALVSNAGFWRVSGWFSSNNGVNTALNTPALLLSDGLTTKTLISCRSNGSGTTSIIREFDVIVFVRSGDTLSVSSAGGSDDNAYSVWYRQIADVSGNLTNPTGFTSS